MRVIYVTVAYLILSSFKESMYQLIYCPKYENGEWKSRTIRELEEMSKGENIVK